VFWRATAATEVEPAAARSPTTGASAPAARVQGAKPQEGVHPDAGAEKAGAPSTPIGPHSDAPGVPYGLWEPLVNAFTSHINAIATAVPRHLLHQAEVADRAGHVFKFRTSAAGLRQCRARNPSFTVIYLHFPDFTRLGVGCDLTSLRP
jgi:hypothetical protein